MATAPVVASCSTLRVSHVQSCSTSYIVVYFRVVVTSELLTFVETAVFTKRITALGLEESLRVLQRALLENPEAGTSSRARAVSEKFVLPIPTRGKGKKGGARVHYLWLPDKARIYLMFVYAKNESSGLTVEQKKQLRTVVVQIKRSSEKESKA